MKTIWKYTLAPQYSAEMPEGAQILSVGGQRGEICMWALVDPEAVLVRRYFAVFGTGHQVTNKPMSFIGTAMLDDGGLVFHVFEVLEA